MDRQQLVDAVARRCGARGWRASPVATRLAAQVGVGEHGAQVPGHRRRRRGAMQEGARREQALAVAPWRADQRDAAGQRLEHADGGDAGQRLDVGPARARGRSPGARAKRCGHRVVGQPAAIARCRPRPAQPGPPAGSARRGPRRAARAGATGSSRNSRSSALRSPSPQLPIQTRSPLGLGVRDAGGTARVSAASCQTQTRLRPAGGEIALAQARAEGEHAVVAVEVSARRSRPGR